MNRRRADEYNFIIVGGGSAGSVLANRLSSRTQNNVLLIEAGIDTPDGKTPEDILDSYPGFAFLNPQYHWPNLKATTELVSPNATPMIRQSLQSRKYEQAKVMGGGSSINGQLFNRGSPEDYENWVSRGAAGWSWDAVLPFFKQVERDLDFENDHHGSTGRIPVRRIFPEQWCGHTLAYGQAFEEAGYKYLADQNAEFLDGFFPLTISNAEERRVSSAAGYLDSKTRCRGNLKILSDTVVSELLFEGTKCIGVQTMFQGKENIHLAKEVILSCGAIHSPAMLLRAGIGPALQLKNLGIDVVANRPGVGQGLMDHPSVALAGFIKPFARVNSNTRRHLLAGLRYSSGIHEQQGDMFIAIASKSAWHAVGEQIGSAIISVNRVCSESGRVTLASSDWREEPIVDFNLLSDQRDLHRLMDGIRRAAAFHEHDALSSAVSEVFPAIWGKNVRRLGAPTRVNKVISKLASQLLDGPNWLRRSIMQSFVCDRFTLSDVLSDDSALEEFVREGAVGHWHASCSCRMGAESDPNSVTDSSGHVFGVSGLRVVDASIFPSIPSANTNFPVMMVAEKIASAILAE